MGVWGVLRLDEKSPRVFKLGSRIWRRNQDAVLSDQSSQTSIPCKSGNIFILKDPFLSHATNRQHAL
ncbi:hypothetical protein BN1723_005853 [Verticillium longisporum]|uniref:Uncharacterized protein n=1 Tax=Verticillium longisporum TaxID=100787 RepID=A0A0G4NBK7_VERLO|nr:hypothetical protein HYQ44_003059 [Verticillium longisporum]CRK43803.1 hypothetical protein BN1723_005853 [Verticillium longisporum]